MSAISSRKRLILSRKAPKQSISSHPSSFRDQHWLLYLLERWLVLARTTVIIPLHKRVVFVRFLNCPEFSGRLSKISQAHNTISGIQFCVGSRGLHERWSLGSVPVSSSSGV